MLTQKKKSAPKQTLDRRDSFSDNTSSERERSPSVLRNLKMERERERERERPFGLHQDGERTSSISLSQCSISHDRAGGGQTRPIKG
jgi:hypothetical protein